MTIVEIAYHRNGVGGEGFHAVLFKANFEGREELFLATVFPEAGHVAVISVDRIASSGVAFGDNSWRGDHFESRLRRAIAKHDGTDTATES